MPTPRESSKAVLVSPNEIDAGTIRTRSIVPVDLNAALYRIERRLASMREALGRDGAPYDAAADARAAAMNGVLWDGAAHRWRDVVLDDRGATTWASPGPALSDFCMPLWAGLDPPDGDVAALVFLAAREAWVVRSAPPRSVVLPPRRPPSRPAAAPRSVVSPPAAASRRPSQVAALQEETSALSEVMV